MSNDTKKPPAIRADGYVNMMTKYGTRRDPSAAFRYAPEPLLSDTFLAEIYESNGLFAKIIDTPAEEALKHGFRLEGLADRKIENYLRETLESLDWEETAITALKWARLFGGSIAVMLINDGRGIEDPLDWGSIKSVDDIRVYDRSVIHPDYATLFTGGSKLGMPEYYDVYSKWGTFRVHDSRVLVFQNGVLPERTSNPDFELWGVPEYYRIQNAIRDTTVAHGIAPKMLDRAIQAVYKVKDLSAQLATEGGEKLVLKRLEMLDLARGLLNSVAIDADGEDYGFQTANYTGVSDLLSATRAFLSAVSNIPQTVLFGEAISGFSATDDTTMEIFYNYCDRIRRRSVLSNLRYLLRVAIHAGVNRGIIDEPFTPKVEFEPLWMLTEVEKADVDRKRAEAQRIRAEAAAIYHSIGALSSLEIRRGLAKVEQFDPETVLDRRDR